MRRTLLIAIGLAALLWAVTARPAPTQPVAATLSADSSCLLTSDSHGPSDADLAWRVQHHTVAAVTESLWKFASAQAALTPNPATVASALDTTQAASSPDPPARSAPQYLRHTPLLI